MEGTFTTSIAIDLQIANCDNTLYYTVEPEYKDTHICLVSAGIRTVLTFQEPSLTLLLGCIDTHHIEGCPLPIIKIMNKREVVA